MRRDLLTIGANLLRSDAANPTGVKFDLGTWMERGDVEGGTGAQGAKWTAETLPEAIPVSCGTKACAFGLMAISGAFKEQGLGYKAEPYRDYNNGVGLLLLQPVLDIGRGENNPTAFEAAARLFEISKEDAAYFFDPCCYHETPIGAQGEIEVAERIENFINGDIDERQHPDTRHEYDDED